MTGTATPKPQRRGRKPRRIRPVSAKLRAESPTKTRVREQCVDRDGYCRVGKDTGAICEGPSEWAHFGNKKRWKTRGMKPEQRHTTAGSFMSCRRHHRAYDRGDLVVEPNDPARGCNGDLSYHAKAAA